jgi:hypothetical protein
MARSPTVSCGAGAASSDASSAAWASLEKLGRGWMSRCQPEAERAWVVETAREKREGRFAGFLPFTDSSVGGA